MPIPDYLRSELGRYSIGQKLKALRLRRSMGLLQLGQRTGLSPALLSKIENNKLVPTVPTLLRIALVFGVALDHFFQNEQRQRVVSITRKDDSEKSVLAEPGSDNCYHLTRLDLGSGERKFQPYLAEYYPDKEARVKPHMHQGVEFIHILCGTLQLLVGADEHILQQGDSIYFDSNLRHAYRSMGEEKCLALTVLAQPERNVTERRMERLEGIHAVRKPGQSADTVKTAVVQHVALNGNAMQQKKAFRQQV